MANFTKITHVLLSDEQYRSLSKMAKEQKKSIAAIVRDAIGQVYTTSPTKSLEKKPLRDYQFYGMWKDRSDIVDSTEWVRKHRESWNERLKRN